MFSFAFFTKRIQEHWPLWLILFAGCLLSVTLLSLGPILSESIISIGLQSRLESNRDTGSHVRLSTRSEPLLADVESLDETVADGVAERFGAVIANVIANGHTTQYFPWIDGALATEERLAFRYYDPDGIDEQVRFVAGAWPAADAYSGDASLPVVLSQGAADHYDVALGDELFVSRRANDNEPTRSVVVHGIIEAIDPEAPYWFGRFSPLIPFSDGRYDAEYSFLLPRELLIDFAAAELPENDLSLSWFILITPDMSEVEARSLIDLIREWREITLQGGTLRVDTTLDATLQDYLAENVVVRPPLLLLLGLVVMIGVYFVLIVATLMLMAMRPEFAKLDSRGASLRQLFQLQLREALILVAVAFLLGPLLAWLLVRIIMSFGAIPAVLSSPPVVRLAAGAWLYAGVGSLIVLAGLMLPVPGGLRRSIANRARAQSRSVWQRYHIDIFLLVIGIILVWRTGLFGSFIGALTGPQSARVDWLLLLTPMLLMVALTTVMSRLVPFMLRVGANWAGRLPGLPGAMAFWHAARNPIHVTRLLLLIAMATTLGIIASSLTTTLTRNEVDRAGFTVGAPHRVISSVPFPADGEGSQVWRTEGVIDVANSRGDRFELLAIEPDTLNSFVQVRDDFADLPLEDVLATLQADVLAAHNDPDYTTLQGQPTSLQLAMHIQSADVEELLPRFAFDIKLRTADDRFVLGHLTPQSTPEAPSWVTFAGNLPELAAEAYPLQLMSVWFRLGDAVWILPDNSPVIDDLIAIDAAGAAQLVSGYEIGDRQPWVSLERSMFLSRNVEWSRTGKSGLMVGFGFQQTVVGYWYGMHPWDGTLASSLPIVVTQPFLDSTGAEVGDYVSVRINTQVSNSWRPFRFQVAGVVKNFPTMADGEPAGSVLVWQTPLLHRLNAETHNAIYPDELWLDAPPSAAIQAQLDAATYNDSINQLLNRLRTQPTSVGLRTITQLGFVMAIFFAVTSISTYLFLSIRQSESQHAVLRALGMSEGQLYATLVVEQAVIVVLGLLFGTVTGIFLSRQFLRNLPLFLGDALTQPSFVVVIDWRAIAFVYGAVILTLFLIALILIPMLRRQQLQRSLRTLEEAL